MFFPCELISFTARSWQRAVDLKTILELTRAVKQTPGNLYQLLAIALSVVIGEKEVYALVVYKMQLGIYPGII